MEDERDRMDISPRREPPNKKRPRSPDPMDMEQHHFRPLVSRSLISNYTSINLTDICVETSLVEPRIGKRAFESG